ncbi:MAG TPA: M56 family metallopeptidase [Thermoanaerobaculia bacterium]
MTPLLADVVAWWLQCGLLLSAGILLPALLRLRDPGVRLRLGQLLLGGALLLPVLQPRREAVPSGAGAAPFNFLVIAAAEPASRVLSLETAVLIALAGGALLRVAYLAVGLLRLRKIRGRATPFPEIPLSITAAAARTSVRVDVLVSADVTSPVTVGMRRPVVLVPEDFAHLPPLEQEAIACHEFLHVARRDGWSVLLEEITRALLWHQPAAWAVLSRVQLDREQAVDRETVAATGDRPTYLRALARLAQRAAAAPASAIPFQTRSHAVERMTALAKEVPMSRLRTTLLTALATFLLTVVAAAGSFAFPLADDPKPAGSRSTPSGDTIYETGGPVSEPVEVSRPRPVYPPEAREKRLTGIVTLTAVIGETGKVTRVEPLGSPDPMLAAAAVEAVGKWTYKPATKGGKPVKVRLQVRVSFMLDTKPPK